LYQGESITKLRPYKIAKLGIARTFQNIRLFGTLSALENIVVARHIHTKSNVFNGILSLPSAAREEKIALAKGKELLNLVGLGDRATEKACNFSYGDQRRLEIARALALNPKILLLDEPAAGMNTGEKQSLSVFIRQISTQFELK
jgi:branched-chain amino acid transport system ATP-binding protein